MVAPATSSPQKQPSKQDLLQAEALLRDATLSLEKEDYEAAENSLAKALTVVPKHPGCFACLALCLAEGRRKFLTAEKFACNAVLLAPNRPQGYLALGRIYQLGSRFEDAYRNYQQAHRLAPKDVRIREKLEEVRKQRMPLLKLAPDNHPIGTVLSRFADFLVRDHHLALVTGALLVIVVWLGLTLYGKSVGEKEKQLANIEGRTTYVLEAVQGIDKGS